LPKTRIHRASTDINSGVTTAMREEVLHRAWPLVVRVAAVAGLLAAALGATLYRFAGVSATPIVAATALVGLVIGLRLPAARPSRPSWLRR
jgi:MFS superfamily sulfate permease-like transporter